MHSLQFTHLLRCTPDYAHCNRPEIVLMFGFAYCAETDCWVAKLGDRG